MKLAVDRVEPRFKTDISVNWPKLLVSVILLETNLKLVFKLLLTVWAVLIIFPPFNNLIPSALLVCEIEWCQHGYCENVMYKMYASSLQNLMRASSVRFQRIRCTYTLKACIICYNLCSYFHLYFNNWNLYISYHGWSYFDQSRFTFNIFLYRQS